MSKKNKIIYWIATIWLSLGMLSTGLVQLFKIKEEVAKITTLGYPTYILTIVGIWKILGVIAVLTPRFPLIKEWAYAGFFFIMSGAVFSHIAVEDPLKELFGPMLLILLTIVSWYLRPINKKLIPIHKHTV